MYSLITLHNESLLGYAVLSVLLILFQLTLLLDDKRTLNIMFAAIGVVIEKARGGQTDRLRQFMKSLHLIDY